MDLRQTDIARVERLLAEGIDDAKFSRIMARIGIDIGTRALEGTATAIIAEIISPEASTSVVSLRDGSDLIHTPFNWKRMSMAAVLAYAPDGSGPG